MKRLNYYFSKNRITMVPLNHWDVLALVIIFAVIALIAIGTKAMTVPYQIGEALPISLDPSHLPFYALRSVLRMFIALFFSLLFTFIFGTWAAKNKHAERVIIPIVDVLQSVPVLGFLSITVVAFINLFHGSLLGPECAAIFVIFTAQAWNMTLSLYQSLRIIPHELIEAANMLQLSAWQRFWRIEIPYAVPGLLWNTMMSMSASWFFVVAAEAISIANTEINLPGIGSYIARAINEANMPAVYYAIITMFFVILIYDQLLFRPLIKWADKFNPESEGYDSKSLTWVTRVLQHTRALQYTKGFFSRAFDSFVNFPLFRRRKENFDNVLPRRFYVSLTLLWYVLLWILLAGGLYILISFIIHNITLHEIGHVFLLGMATTLRVFAVIVFCTCVWVPLGVWIGMRPNLAKVMQPVIQFLASFPAYLLFPLVVFVIIRNHLNAEIWVTPLMIIGTQWYVAFNIIAGTLLIPKELHLAARNLNLRGWLRWRRFLIPAIFPFYVTGAITAVGGAWNTSIVAEVVSWGGTTLQTTGLGAYIAEYTNQLDYPRIALGISVMALYVLFFNRIIWRPLFLYAEKHFRLD